MTKKCSSGRCQKRQNGQTVEQECRDILERMGVTNAQSLSAGDLMEMANVFTERNYLKRQLAAYRANRSRVTQ